MISLKGICTRAGDVKPLIEVACLTCDSCGFEIYQVFWPDPTSPMLLFRDFIKFICIHQEILGETFNPINKCPSGMCRSSSNTKGDIPKCFYVGATLWLLSSFSCRSFSGDESFKVYQIPGTIWKYTTFYWKEPCKISQLTLNMTCWCQEVKVQEMSEHVPVGQIPRSITVQVKGSLTRRVG